MIDVIFLPEMLSPRICGQSQVVVLDVLRASTTIVTALRNGAREVRLFDDIEKARVERTHVPAPALLAGERQCVKVPGFDLGNSPAEYPTHVVGNASILLTTTNGTRAATAAAGARHLYIGALVNAAATTEALLPAIDTMHTLLLCAGTDGRIAVEDVIGAGAILWHLLQKTYRADLPFTDTAWLAYHTFGAVRNKAGAALRLGQGGIQLIEAGFEDDIDLCAEIDSMPVVATVLADPPRVVKEIDSR